MIKKRPDVIIKFTADELAAIKSIAEFDCEDVNCSECECEALLKQLDDNRRL